jgi:hypothetical protein
MGVGAMSCGKVLKLFLISCLPVLLSVCKLNVDIPDYSLEFKGTKIYPTGTIISVSYRFNAEETYHRCRFKLSELTGAILDSGQTEPLKAGEWHTYQKDLTESPDGVYEFQLIVQAEKSSRDYIDLSFLDKAFEFYIDEFPPDPPDISLPSGIFSETQYVTMNHDEWSIPLGSPVEIYYKIDGDPLAADAILYNKKTAIEITSNEPTHVLSAVAKDQAGGVSLVNSVDYDFLEISAVENAVAMEDPKNWGDLDTVVNISIKGYGFANPFEAHVYDKNKTEAPIFSGPTLKSDTEIALSVELYSSKGIVAGTGYVEVTVSPSNTATDTYPFDIIP